MGGGVESRPRDRDGSRTAKRLCAAFRAREVEGRPRDRDGSRTTKWLCVAIPVGGVEGRPRNRDCSRKARWQCAAIRIRKLKGDREIVDAAVKQSVREAVAAAAKKLYHLLQPAF